MIEYIDERRCEGCRICEDACPLDVIRVDDLSGKARVAYLEDCMTCYNCERLCPNGAIHVDPFVKKQQQVW